MFRGTDQQRKQRLQPGKYPAQRVFRRSDAFRQRLVFITIQRENTDNVYGLETFYYGDSRLATLVHQRVYQTVGSILDGFYRNRGIEERDLPFLTYLAEMMVLACLVEVEFINNPRRWPALRSGRIPDHAALGIAEAIYEFLGGVPDYRRYFYSAVKSLYDRYPWLFWNFSRKYSEEKTTHYVYRKEQGEEDYNVIAAVTDTFFVDSTVEPGKKYTYFVSFTGSGYPLNTSTPITLHTAHSNLTGG